MTIDAGRAPSQARRTYPYVNARVWWDLRRRFKTTMPKGEVNAGYLAGVLGIGEKAAANVVPALRALGLIDDAGHTTDRANAWRDDTLYPQVTAAMLEEVYPQELRDMAPPPQPDRDAVERWFMRETGAGEAAIGMMARAYLLLAAGDVAGDQPAQDRPQPARPRPAAAKGPRGGDAPVRARAAVPAAKGAPADGQPPAGAVAPSVSGRHLTPSVHIDIQVHIDPAATAEQIDQIFASMARHLYGRD